LQQNFKRSSYNHKKSVFIYRGLTFPESVNLVSRAPPYLHSRGLCVFSSKVYYKVAPPNNRNELSLSLLHVSSARSLKLYHMYQTISVVH